MAIFVVSAELNTSQCIMKTKFMNFMFASKLTYTLIFMPQLHFYKILKCSIILTTFFTIIVSLFRPVKVAKTRLGQKDEL